MPHSESSQQSPTAEQASSRASVHHQSPSTQEMQAAVDMFSAGRFAEAVALAAKLTVRFPVHSFGWKLLGSIYAQTGRSMEALEPLRKAAALLPTDAEVHNSLASALVDTHQLDAAMESCLRALDLRPDFAEARNNLGGIFIRLARFADALSVCRRALEGRPDFSAAYCNLGNALNALGRFDDAIASYRRALEIEPDRVDAHYNLGNSLRDLGQLDAALISYHRALEIGPEFPQAHYNLGNALRDLGQLDAAINNFRRAIEIDPTYADAHSNLGNALRDFGQLDAASISYRRALETKPNFHAATWNLGLTLLAQGRYTEGWPCYEARTTLSDKKMLTAPDLPFPPWQGHPLVGCSIVIVEEQGIGDDLQFCRFAVTLKEIGAARVTLLCKDRLQSLFSRVNGVDSVIERSAIATVEPHDFWVHAQSLPLHCGTTVETIPADVPYLFADDALTAQIASEIGPPAGLKIGICWKGSVTYKGDAERSPGLGFFRPIFGIDGVRIYTLLPNSRAELLANAGEGVSDIGHEVDEFTAPFEETAALIMNLDLVITCDTSICHLAGALGKPVWLVLPYAAHWVWMTDREDSPWYPNTRLFRQTERGNWAGVFERVAKKLRAVLAGETPLVWPVK